MHIHITPKFKAGDLPPDGYLEWHEWAAVQIAAGIWQKLCDDCDKFHTPQELPCKAQSAEPREE